MKTVKFLRTTYIIEPGLGLPSGATDVSTLTSKAQVELYNLLADNLGGKGVTKFKDKVTATKRINAALDAWNELPDGSTSPAPEPVKPAKKKTERKKRGLRFMFPFNGKDSIRSIRSSGTLRGQCVALLTGGATFAKVEALVEQFDADRGKVSKHVLRRAYELVRIMHYYVGYGVDHDQATGLIKLHTRPVGQTKS